MKQVTLELFKDFLISQKQEETLLAWIAIRRFRTLQQATARAPVAAAIIDEFVRENSALQVNLSASLRQELLTCAAHGDDRVELFDGAWAELFSLLRSNSWAPFMESHAFKLVPLILNHPLFSLAMRG